ncbi:hypothetical protein D7030_00450 [Flavobacteriaceae bacterium AU392]|nr:hypothetical protein D1817_12285 [Flavobacteriaceae bacterium]RKM86805.1 hypothetical protein D7030_00450 [Flavobacteriaceae bacterium AU392]
MQKVGSVEEYIERHENYTEALTVLRDLFNTTELVETLKWGAPTYTINSKNVVGLGAFKHHFGIWFFNGVFLKDASNVLVNAQEGKTKAMRQWRFTSIEEINKDLVMLYINEAIENQKLGKEIKVDRSKKEVIIPIELQRELKTDSKLNTAFATLTPYKQREYCEYIDTAKQEKTKLNRIEKMKPMIINGIGLNDKYKNC